MCESFTDEVSTTDSPQRRGRSLRLISEVMIVGSPAGSAAFQRDGHAVFHSFEFNPGGSRAPSMQRLHVGRTLKASDPPLSRDGQVAYESTTLVSGVCIFSYRILNRSLGNEDPKGELDVALLYRSAITFAEVEYIARLSSATVDVAALLGARYNSCAAPADATIRVILDVPAWQ